MLGAAAATQKCLARLLSLQYSNVPRTGASCVPSRVNAEVPSERLYSQVPSSGATVFAVCTVTCVWPLHATSTVSSYCVQKSEQYASEDSFKLLSAEMPTTLHVYACVCLCVCVCPSLPLACACVCYFVLFVAHNSCPQTAEMCPDPSVRTAARHETLNSSYF